MTDNPINDLAAAIPIAAVDCPECEAQTGQQHELSCDEVPVDVALAFLGIPPTTLEDAA